jgi:peptidyl-prolyl cis-trans isomerase D
MRGKITTSRSVSMGEYKRDFDGFKAQVEQQVQQQITPEVAVANGLDRRVLQGIASREAFAELLTKIGVRPADKQIAAEIQKIPAFFDQVTGRFDKASYQQKLATNNLTAAAFEAKMRDQITEQEVGTGLVAGLRAPRAYAAMALAAVAGGICAAVAHRASRDATL